ncbi:MAG: DUF2782 domain-containing protein [Motiliproteus sp.]|nr:DUF2782 domain-containing protein [Motiliproteus sp.]
MNAGKIKSLLLAALLLTFTPLIVQAAEPEYSEDEPEIVIRKGTEGKVFYEYVRNGEIIEIKVVPEIGKPYYLVPATGHEGYIRMDESQLLVPKWVLFRW